MDTILTGNGKITKQLIRVWSTEELDEVDVGIFPSDHRGNIEGVKDLKRATELQRLLVVRVELWEFFLLNLDTLVLDNLWHLLLILDWNDLLLDLVHSLLDCIDCRGRHDEVRGAWRLIKLKLCDVKLWVCWWMAIRRINCCLYRRTASHGLEYIIMASKRLLFTSHLYLRDGTLAEHASLRYHSEDVPLSDTDQSHVEKGLAHHFLTVFLALSGRAPQKCMV